MSIKTYYKHSYRGSIIARAHLDNISFRTYTQSSRIKLHEKWTGSSFPQRSCEGLWMGLNRLYGSSHPLNTQSYIMNLYIHYIYIYLIDCSLSFVPFRVKKNCRQIFYKHSDKWKLKVSAWKYKMVPSFFQFHQQYDPKLLKPTLHLLGRAGGDKTTRKKHFGSLPIIKPSLWWNETYFIAFTCTFDSDMTA